jgi:hypothetical protein
LKKGAGDFRNILNHRIYLQQHLPIIKPQHLQTQAIKIFITHPVGLLMFRLIVLTAVDFDD